LIARAFLRQHNISQQEIDTVWTAIALHATVLFRRAATRIPTATANYFELRTSLLPREAQLGSRDLLRIISLGVFRRDGIGYKRLLCCGLNLET
jgi:hypothetical protein